MSGTHSIIRWVPSDPNWFYSTLAQSTAALVGLAGGFLAQRVVAQRGDLGTERMDLRRNLETLQANIDQQRQVATAALNSMNEQLKVVDHARFESRNDVRLQRGLLTTLTPARGYASDAEERQPVESARKLITETRDTAAALLDVFPQHVDTLIKRAEQASLDAKEHTWLRDPPGEFPFEGIDPDNVWRWLNFQRAFAQQMFREQDRALELLSAQLLRLRAKLLPRSLYVFSGSSRRSWWQTYSRPCSFSARRTMRLSPC